PRDLETICLKCLRKEPGLRYATAAELGKDLISFQRGEAISARPEGPLAKLTRHVRRRPALSAVIAVSALLVLVLISGTLWLLSVRQATARAADEDLHEMAQRLRDSSWPEARAARDRAKTRLGDRGPVELHGRLEQGTRDLELATRLDLIR